MSGAKLVTAASTACESIKSPDCQHPACSGHFGAASSKFRTSSPRRKSSAMRLVPINPLPPVRKIRIVKNQPNRGEPAGQQPV